MFALVTIAVAIAVAVALIAIAVALITVAVALIAIAIARITVTVAVARITVTVAVARITVARFDVPRPRTVHDCGLACRVEGRVAHGAAETELHEGGDAEPRVSLERWSGLRPLAMHWNGHADSCTHDSVLVRANDP
jgi:hypothetical protein